MATRPTPIRSQSLLLTRLTEVIRQLGDIGADMAAQGLDDQAASITTVIHDLLWQAEELNRVRNSGEDHIARCPLPLPLQLHRRLT